jgi:hypothetical protein
MRLCIFATLGVAISSTGCTHLALERSSLRQASTLTDIRYIQVLENLAMIATNPSLLPHYVVLGDGTAEIIDQASANPSLTLTRAMGIGTNTEVLSAMGQRSIRENWTLTPLHDPERLLTMRCVYHIMLGQGSISDDCDKEIHRFRLENELGKIPPGWYHLGKKCDVPPCACFVGRYCDNYAWVAADGIEGLTRLSMVILDIATVDLSSLDPPTKTVETTYDGACNRTLVKVTTKIDASADDCTKDGQAPPPAAPRYKQRMLYNATPRSLFSPR